MSGAACKVIICGVPPGFAATLPATRGAIEAAIEAAKHAADLPGTERQWMALAATLEHTAAELRDIDEKLAANITAVLATVLP